MTDSMDSRRFSMRNSVSVSFTHPELVSIVDPKEIKNLGIIDPSLVDRNVNILASRNSCQDAGEKSPMMFKEIGESFVLHSKTNSEEMPGCTSNSTKNKIRRSRNDRSKQTTLATTAATTETEPNALRVETKQSEPSIHTPSVNEIDPCQNGLSSSRQTTERSEENIFNKTLVSNASLEKDLPVQISDHQLSFQTLLDNLQISKDAGNNHKDSRPQTNPFSSQIQTENSLELHNVYEELPEQRALKYATRGSDGRAKSCVHILPDSMNKSELESLYDKLESPTKEDKMLVERQIRSSRSFGNIFQNQPAAQATNNGSKQGSAQKTKRSGEFNLPLQQSHSGKKSSKSMDRGNSSSQRRGGGNYHDNVIKRLNMNNNARNHLQQEDLNDSGAYNESEVDYYDNIDAQRLSLHVKMATKDYLATPPQYSARIPVTQRDLNDYGRLKTQQYEKISQNSSARNRVEREYLADMNRKKRLAEIVLQTNKTQNQRQKSASNNTQNKKMVKKTIVQEERVVKSKTQTRRESYVDVSAIIGVGAENKRDVSNEKSVNKEIIIDRPLQMKSSSNKKEEIHLGSINTLRLKRQNPENVLFNKPQNKSTTARRSGGFGNITDRINFNETVVLNKSQDLSRSFARSERNKNIAGKTPKVFDANKTQEVEKVITSEPSIRETKGWSNTLEAVMSGISVGGVSKTWESLTRKISTTVNSNDVAAKAEIQEQLQQSRELLNEALQAQIAAESKAILTNQQQESNGKQEINSSSQFDIKKINLDRLALILLRQTEEKAARRIQRFVIRKYNLKPRKFNNEIEPKETENLENLWKHYEELYSKISGSLGVEGTKFNQKELIMTFITISCFLNSKQK